MNSERFTVEGQIIESKSIHFILIITLEKLFSDSNAPTSQWFQKGESSVDQRILCGVLDGFIKWSESRRSTYCERIFPPNLYVPQQGQNNEVVL